MVFAERAAPNQRETDEPAGSSRASQYSAATGRSKIKSRRELESEYGAQVRKNEGEAANYGIYYDDTEYDYMQHMRDLGSGSGDSYFIEPKAEKKGKQKMDLADMLRDASLNDSRSQADLSVSSNISSASELFGEDMAPSEFVRKTTYQDQQDVPDALKGFQPDMDPRLREVLEALEDEAYVDDSDDIFNELAQDGFEVDQREWDSADLFDDDEDQRDPMDRFLSEEDPGWETDDTIKASSPKLRAQKPSTDPTDPSSLPAPDEAPAPADAADMAYLDEFKKFKQDVKAAKPTPGNPRNGAAAADNQSFITGASALTAGGRRKKRKGAQTSTSGYSMSSSALHRTEGLTLLDQRFDKIEEEYADDDGFPEDDYGYDDSASMVSGMSKMSGISKMSGMSGWSSSEAPPLRGDFDSIMDDFLGSHHTAGKSGRRVKKGKQQSGMEQLDEVRKGLGAPKVKPQDRFSVLKV